MFPASKKLYILVLSIALISLLLSCIWPSQQPSLPQPNLSTLPALEVGDWVFRSGTSADSLVIRQLSGSHHSHIGMIVGLEPQVQIIHATTDDDPQYLDQVLLSSLDEFVQPALAKEFAIARPSFLSPLEKQQIAQLLLEQRGAAFLIQKKGLPHRYCTTLLANAIHSITGDFTPQWQQVDLAFYRGEYLFPKAFAEYPKLQWIYQSPAQALSN